VGGEREGNHKGSVESYETRNGNRKSYEKYRHFFLKNCQRVGESVYEYFGLLLEVFRSLKMSVFR